LWKNEMRDVVVLTESERQRGHHEWQELLNGIRTGHARQQDIDMLNDRVHGRNGIDIMGEPWTYAVRLFPTNSEVAGHNSRRLLALGADVNRVWAGHTVAGAGPRACS